MPTRIKNTFNEGNLTLDGGFEGTLNVDKDLNYGELAFDANELPIQAFLYAMQVKGARICDDLQVVADGKVFLSDGTSLASISKEIEVVFGVLSEVDGEYSFSVRNPANKFVSNLGTDTEPLNSDSDSVYGGLDLSDLNSDFTVQGEGKWYLRLTRPNGSVIYKEMKGINDVLDSSTLDEQVSSLPEVMKQLHDLGVAVKQALSQNQLSRMQDVDALESNWDLYIQSVKEDLDTLETDLVNTADAADLAIYNQIMGNVENAQLSIQGTFNYDHGSVSISFESLSSNDTVTAIFELGNGENTLRPSIIDPDRHDIKNWLVKAVVHDPDDVMIINDSIWHKAYIENGQIKVDVRAVDCQELVAGRTVEVTVSYAGPMAVIDSTTATMVEVSFNTDGGSSLAANDVVFGKSYGELPVPLKEGHSFEGWYTGPNGTGDLVSSLSYVTSSSSITLYAKWSASYVTLSFDSNGGSSCADTEVIPSTAYGALCTPTRAGYTFGGWHDGEDINALESFPSLKYPRSNHAMVKLQSGKVMVIGGFNDELGYLSSVEIYDPQTNEWTDGPSMNNARLRMTATLLPSGKVFVFGGFGIVPGTATTTYRSSPELFDPSLNGGVGGWQILTAPTPEASYTRQGHTATLIESGVNQGKVLIAGGYNGGYLSTSYLYNPSDDTWSSSLTGFTAREKHTATCLDDGRILVAGGYNLSYLNTCLIFDSSTNSWSSTTGFVTGRQDHTATKLNDGRVLVAGGYGAVGYLSTVQTFNPSDNSWITCPSLTGLRQGHVSIMLTSGVNQGKVLITGGYGVAAGVLSYLGLTELFDPSNDSWSLSHPSLMNERASATVICLNDGRVMVAGGVNPNYLSSVEGYDLEKTLDPIVTSESIVTDIDNHTLYADWDLNSYTISFNSNGGTTASATTRSFDTSYLSLPSTSRLGYQFLGWYEGNNFDVSSATSPMSIARYSHASTLLNDGKVLVTGGYGWTGTTAGYLNSAEVYDPETETWETVGTFVGARFNHTATLITSGPKAGYVLIVGGWNGSTRLSTAYLYNPSTKAFESAGSLTTIREGHKATLLADGKRVLITGGTSGSYLNTSQIYDSETNTWLSEQTFAGGARISHTATLLTSGPYAGNVLLIGGYNTTTYYLSNIQLFDPNQNGGSGSWSTPMTNSGFIGRSNHTANILPDGRILVIGGNIIGATSESVQVLSSDLMNWTNLKKTTIGFASHDSFLLNGNKVLVVGGGYAQVYDYVNDIWGPLSQQRYTFSVVSMKTTLLSDGDNILITGGYRGAIALNKAEILNITQLQTSSSLARSEIMISNPSNYTLYAKWNDMPSYTLTFDSQLGSAVTAKSVVKGVEYQTLSSPTRTGYTFAGWWTGINGTGTQVTANTIVTATANHTIYAKWLANYTITYDVQGGVACSPTTKTVVFSQTYGTLCTPTRTGYIFDGWYTGTGGTGSLITSSSTVNITSNQTLYAKWAATITYDSRGGTTCSSTNFTSGSTYGTLCTPTYENATFLGWYLSTDWNGAWSTNTPSLTTTREGHTETLLNDGRVLVVGGYNGTFLTSAQIYDPIANTWSTNTTSLTTGRAYHTATLLNDGRVLIVGGTTSGANLPSSYLATAQIYDPVANTWSTNTPSLTTGRKNHTATLLSDGRVLIVGGNNVAYSFGSYNTFHLATAQIYNPVTNTWSTNTPSLTTAREGHTATLLSNGKVLIVGGYNSSLTYISSAQIYDPVANTWSTNTPSLATTRSAHTATLLSNGKVLIVGGASSLATLSSNEVYDPVTNTWSTNIPTLTTGRYNHTATLLSNEKVLIVGGYNSSLTYISSAQIYDPVANTWSTNTPSLEVDRRKHTATLLSNGKVLIVGGSNSTYLSSAQIYDVNYMINSSTIISLTTSHTLYAKWNYNSITYTYDSQEGSACLPASFSVTDGENIPTLCSPTKAGYLFDGWYTQSNGGGQLIIGNTAVAITQNQTLYAKWIVGGEFIIGTGTVSIGGTSYPTPYSSYFDSAKQQYFITAAELSNAGLTGKNIISIGFNVVLDKAVVYNSFELVVYPTANTNPISAGWVNAGGVASFTASNMTTNPGWNQHTLNTPYTWDGTSGLVIQVCSYSLSSYTNESVQTSNLSGATFSRWYRLDGTSSVCSSTLTTGTSTTTRPNMKFITSN